MVASKEQGKDRVYSGFRGSQLRIAFGLCVAGGREIYALGAGIIKSGIVVLGRLADLEHLFPLGRPVRVASLPGGQHLGVAHAARAAQPPPYRRPCSHRTAKLRRTSLQSRRAATHHVFVHFDLRWCAVGQDSDPTVYIDLTVTLDDPTDDVRLLLSDR